MAIDKCRVIPSSDVPDAYMEEVYDMVSTIAEAISEINIKNMGMFLSALNIYHSHLLASYVADDKLDEALEQECKAFIGNAKAAMHNFRQMKKEE